MLKSDLHIKPDLEQLLLPLTSAVAVTSLAPTSGIESQSLSSAVTASSVRTVILC